MRHSLAVYCSFLCILNLLVLFNIMNQFAIWIVACIEMRAITKTFISILINNCAKMLFITIRMAFCFLAFISCAMVTVLNIFFGLKFHCLNFLGKAHNVLQLYKWRVTLASISIFSANRDGALSRFSIICLCYFSFPESSFLCCWKVMGSGGEITGLWFLFFKYSSYVLRRLTLSTIVTSLVPNARWDVSIHYLSV